MSGEPYRRNILPGNSLYRGKRVNRCQSSLGPVDLPMSRTDIADYLGLTIETVSRTFTQLQRSQAIALKGSRNIVLRNRVALAAAAA